MNVWKVKAPMQLEKEDCPVPEPEAGKYRVRITKALLSKVDSEVFSGIAKVKLPIVPGRFAVGQIATQTDNPLFPKNMRVLLHAYKEVPDLGRAQKDFSEDDISVCGITEDGFLRDFINASPEEMTPLPDSVSDNDALLVHYVAIAKAVVDKLDAKKGSHVAVVGADFLGIIISQLLIYQQVSPVLIDSQAERLYFAKKCGIYYTMLDNASVIDDVASVTGGRLCDGAIYVKTARVDPILSAQLVQRGSTVVIVALDRTGFNVDLELAMHKRLTISAVSEPEDMLESAINLIVSKAINLDPLRETIKPISNLERFFSEEWSPSMLDTFRIHIFNLLS